MPKGKVNKVNEMVEPVVPTETPVEVLDNNERGSAEPEKATPVVETPVEVVEEFVTLTAANPMQKLEVSVNGLVYSGSSITIPKSQEGDIRRILEGAGMYVRN